MMYNLEVAQDHTFTVGAGQWIVHNCNVGDQLPNRSAGGKTQGVLVADDGVQTQLISGKSGPSSTMPADTPGMRSDMSVRTHVEAHASALMRQEGMTDATLYLNNTPCSGPLGCSQMLPHMLPEGAKLTVIFKDSERGITDWVTREYVGLPDSSWQWSKP